jgi:hypothetical protein
MNAFQRSSPKKATINKKRIVAQKAGFLTVQKQFPRMRQSAAFIKNRRALRVQCLDPVAAHNDPIGG